MIDFIVKWLSSTPELAVPYALAALGLIVSERAGVLNLTAEGLMLVGALAGVVGVHLMSGYPLAALGIAMAAAAAISLLFALLVVALRVNQVIAGLAFVFFCDGLTNLIGTRGNFTNQPIIGLGKLNIGGLANLPYVGRLLFGQDLLVYLTVVIALALSVLLNRTQFGLRLRAVGENPAAADAAGVSVWGHRVLAILIGSALMGLAGGYMSVVHTRIWIQEMSGGRGWIAIALVILARWRPWPALAGAVLFGSIEALIPRLNAAGIQLPQYFLLMTPYLATLAVMTWVAARQRKSAAGPLALGLPYTREERR